MKKQKKSIWITRDGLGGLTHLYYMWSEKPRYHEPSRSWIPSNNPQVVGLCVRGFERATGWKLEGGPESIFEVKLS